MPGGDLAIDLLDADRVGPEQQTALERWKADAVDQPEIDVARIANFAFFQNPRSLA